MKFALLCAVLLIAAPSVRALDPGICTNCHEIRTQIEKWQNSTHRGVACTSCHEDNLVRNLKRLSEHLKGDVPEQPRVAMKNAVAMVQRCRTCHQQQYAEWKAGPHSASYARIFTNKEFNSKHRLMDDCFRCHGMHFDENVAALVTPLDTRGPWRLVNSEMAERPTMPCLTCHSVHRHGGPMQKPDARLGSTQTKSRPSLGLYDRRSRMHIEAALLPLPVVFDGLRPVKMSPDGRQGLCYQCHATLASGSLASGDDRTPAGVHEGLSCFACHQGHQQNTRASCATCHPRLSNCGIDVERMDTTFRDTKSRHNVHTVKCIDCHPSGVPRRSRSTQP